MNKLINLWTFKTLLKGLKEKSFNDVRPFLPFLPYLSPTYLPTHLPTYHGFLSFLSYIWRPFSDLPTQKGGGSLDWASKSQTTNLVGLRAASWIPINTIFILSSKMFTTSKLRVCCNRSPSGYQPMFNNKHTDFSYINLIDLMAKIYSLDD